MNISVESLFQTDSTLYIQYPHCSILKRIEILRFCVPERSHDESGSYSAAAALERGTFQGSHAFSPPHLRGTIHALPEDVK